MRLTSSIIALMLAACEPWPWKEPVETDTPDPTDSSEDSNDPTTSDDTAETGEGGDSGATVEEDVVESACASLGDETQVCCLLLRQGSSDAVAAVDPAVGGAGVAVVELAFGEDFPRRFSGLGREGNTAYACSGSDPVYIFDLVSGDLGPLSGDTCMAITPWRGDASYDDGIVLKGTDSVLVYYAGIESLLDGIPDDYLGEARSYDQRMAMEGDVLYSSGHAPDELERTQLPEMTDLGSIPLEDFDTWVWGMSVVNGVLYLIDDGRGESGTVWASTRLLSFDTETGARLGHVYLDDAYEWNGLTCEAR